MFRRTIPLAGLTIALVASATTPALADDGFYVGALGGESLFHQDKSDADAAIGGAFEGNGLTVLGGSSSIDKRDFAFGGLIGYRFMRSFSVEAGYIDLGKTSYHFSGSVEGPFPIGSGAPLPATANLTAKAKGPTLAALGILPLSPAWEVYGRLGVLFSKVTLTANITVANLPGSATESADSADALVGIGTAWHVGNRVTLRAEYTRFANVGDKEKTGETNIDLLNVGVTYSFR
jgi:hypothetical protein